MLTAVEGIYENGQISWSEPPPAQKKMKVVVTFLEEIEPLPTPLKPRVGGSMKGEIWMSDDFNEPLDDLKDYM